MVAVIQEQPTTEIEANGSQVKNSYNLECVKNPYGLPNSCVAHKVLRELFIERLKDVGEDVPESEIEQQALFAEKVNELMEWRRDVLGEEHNTSKFPVTGKIIKRIENGSNSHREIERNKSFLWSVKAAALGAEVMNFNAINDVGEEANRIKESWKNDNESGYDLNKVKTSFHQFVPWKKNATGKVLSELSGIFEGNISRNNNKNEEYVVDKIAESYAMMKKYNKLNDIEELSYIPGESTFIKWEEALDNDFDNGNINLRAIINIDAKRFGLFGSNSRMAMSNSNDSRSLSDFRNSEKDAGNCKIIKSKVSILARRMELIEKTIDLPPEMSFEKAMEWSKEQQQDEDIAL